MHVKLIYWASLDTPGLASMEGSQE